jgi:hypothetical protein
MQPDETFSDDFLFPMSSRLSYTSSPESDGEFCGDETPRRNTSTRSSHSQVHISPFLQSSSCFCFFKEFYEVVTQESSYFYE